LEGGGLVEEDLVTLPNTIEKLVPLEPDLKPRVEGSGQQFRGAFCF